MHRLTFRKLWRALVCSFEHALADALQEANVDVHVGLDIIDAFRLSYDLYQQRAIHLLIAVLAGLEVGFEMHYTEIFVATDYVAQAVLGEKSPWEGDALDIRRRARYQAPCSSLRYSTFLFWMMFQGLLGFPLDGGARTMPSQRA